MEKKEPLNLSFTKAVNFNLCTKAFNRPLSVRESKAASNSGLLAVDSGFQVMDSWLFVRGTWIPDFNRLLDSKGFRIPKEKVSHEMKEVNKWIVSRESLLHLAG